jgi:fatty-acyl-CoA synthase
MTIGAVLVARATEQPDHVAIVLPPARVTYAQVLGGALDAADEMAAMGVGQGDRVAVLMPNCIQFVEHVFGAALIGAVCVPFNARSEPPELSREIDHAEVSGLVTVAPEGAERDLVAVSRQALALAGCAVPLLVATEHWQSTSRNDATAASRVGSCVTPRDTAVMLYTSGTTSAPKGCLISHEAVVRTGTARIVERQTEPETALWTPCPFFHAGALVPLVGCVATGTTFVTTRRFDAGEALRLLEHERVTMALPLFPAFTDALLDHPDFDSADLSAIRQIFSSGSLQHVRRVQERFAPARLVSGYGMTEVCAVAASSPLSDTDQERRDWDGRPFEGIEISIQDPVSGRQLGEGEVGQIAVRGHCCFEGYYRDEDETRRAFDADGWFRTGDMGMVDAAGHVAFLGRYKDMLKVGGENVSALEVETFLGSLAGVRNVQVVGAPDDRLEEVVAAFVELEPTAVVSTQELIDACAGQLARFKVPRHIVFVERSDWPMSSTKVDKVALRARIKLHLGMRVAS